MKTYDPTHPQPSLVYGTDRTHRTEWLTENERRQWSMFADIAAVIATERVGVFAYKDGIKYDAEGYPVGTHEPVRGRNGYIS